MDELAVSLGFKDSEEMLALVSKPDLSTPGALEKFEQWKKNDGTKAGLLKIFPELGPQ